MGASLSPKVSGEKWLGGAVVCKLKANLSTFSDKFLEDHLQGRAQ
jgi:hypothetical protein